MNDFAGAGHVISPSTSTGTKKPGFFYGYVIVLAGFLVLMILYGTQYSFGVFFKPVLAEFGWSRALTSGAYSINAFLQGFVVIIAGRLSDRFGPRKVVTISGLFLGSGYLLMSQISTAWHIYLFYGLISLGSGTWVPLQSTAARWFVKRRGLMSGIIASGIGAGMLIMPPLANQLISRYTWHTSYFIIGLIALVVTVAAAQLLKREPGQMGQLAYGADAERTEDIGQGTRGLSLREAIRTRQFWIISYGFFTANFCTQVIIVHMVPHATDIGISAAAAATIISVIGVCSIISKISMGSAVDRLGGKRIIVTVSALVSLSFLWLLSANELWMLYLFAVVFAFGYGGFSAVQSPLVAELFGLRAHGAILGMSLFGNFVGGAAAPLMAGRIFDVSGSYFWAFAACVIVGIVSLIATLLLKPVRVSSSTKT